MADNSAVHFSEPDFMTILDGFGFFATTDNIGVRLKDADDFFLRRNLLVLKHASFSLINHLLGKRREVFEDADQALGVFVFHFFELRQNLTRLLDDRLGLIYQRAV